MSSCVSVLHVIESGGVGGAQRAMHLLLRGLGERGFEVGAALPRGGALWNELERDGIRCHDLPIDRLYDTRTGPAVAEFVRRRRYDIVHVHTPKAGMLVRRPAREAGARVVMHVHGLGNRALLESVRLSPWARLRKKVLVALEARADRHTDHFVYVCGADRAKAAPRPEKASLVYNGVDAAEWACGEPEPGRTVLFPARLSIQKDPDTLLRALRYSLDRGAGFRLLLPREGEDAARVLALIRALDLDRDVEYLDPAEPMRTAYARSHLVALTTHWEGQPFAVLESMAAGRAVVATDCGGIPETLGGAGFLVPPRDPAALASLIDALLDEPERLRAAANRARRRVEEHFSLERMMEGIASVYRLLFAGALATRPRP